MNRTILVYNGFQSLHFSEEKLRQIFHILDKWGKYPIPSGELSIAFLDEETIKVMHGEFLNDPTSTDVITFPGDPSDDFAGEICVSVPYAGEYARDHGTTLSYEMNLYLIHGWLHLAGLDDLDSKNREKMRDAESDVMDFLGKAGALVRFELE